MTRSMFAFALLLAAPAAASEPAASEPKLNLGQETALRCSVLFGVIAGDQARHVAGADALPPLGVRGREFFVRTTARLMDETGATPGQVATMARARAAQVRSTIAADRDPSAATRAALQPCLALLDQETPQAVAAPGQTH